MTRRDQDTIQDAIESPADRRRQTLRAVAKTERRQQLIDATIQSIARHGLSGTTMAKVSEIAGTSVGLANFHFATKERMFEATLVHLAQEQRDFWKKGALDAARPLAERLVAIVDSRFDPTICARNKLSIWFAFWGDAGARDIYVRAVGDMDEERLATKVEIIGSLASEGGQTGLDPMATALGLEALYDGLWLNMLLYPDDFKREECWLRALDHIAGLLPATRPYLKDRLTKTGRTMMTKDQSDAA